MEDTEQQPDEFSSLKKEAYCRQMPGGCDCYRSWRGEPIGSPAVSRSIKSLSVS